MMPSRGRFGCWMPMSRCQAHCASVSQRERSSGGVTSVLACNPVPMSRPFLAPDLLLPDGMRGHTDPCPLERNLSDPGALNRMMNSWAGTSALVRLLRSGLRLDCALGGELMCRLACKDTRRCANNYALKLEALYLLEASGARIQAAGELHGVASQVDQFSEEAGVQIEDGDDGNDGASHVPRITRTALEEAIFFAQRYLGFSWRAHGCHYVRDDHYHEFDVLEPLIRAGATVNRWGIGQIGASLVSGATRLHFVAGLDTLFDVELPTGASREGALIIRVDATAAILRAVLAALQAGDNIHAETSDGKTAAHFASRRRSDGRVMSALCEYGAIDPWSAARMQRRSETLQVNVQTGATFAPLSIDERADDRCVARALADCVLSVRTS